MELPPASEFASFRISQYDVDPQIYSVYCCHNQPKVGNDFFELITSSDAAEKELSILHTKAYYTIP